MQNLETKIKNLAQLKKTVKQLRAKGKIIVFTNGCFDILHYGHVKYLQDAKDLGDFLIVAVNSDFSVSRIKGKRRPIVQEGDRLKIIAALQSVDFVVKFNQTTPLKTIKALKPDILVKGSDWPKEEIVGSAYAASYGGKVKTVKLIPGRSTTNLIDKIAKKT